MSLTDKINDAIKDAMKSREKEKLQALRAVKSAILLANTESGSQGLNEDQELKLLQKLVKQRRDSASIYKEQGRDDLFEQENLEAEFISRYLPEQLSEEDLIKELRQVINELGATSMKDMGKVMGTASKRLAGKADGKAISEKVKELLS